jgi:hypothetical protein
VTFTLGTKMRTSTSIDDMDANKAISNGKSVMPGPTTTGTVADSVG